MCLRFLSSRVKDKLAGAHDWTRSAFRSVELFSLVRAAQQRRICCCITAIWFTSALALAEVPSLKVCADPDNLPYSNRSQQGFENRIADLLAQDLHRKLQYRWSRLGRGFIRSVLNSGECDVLITIPKTYPAVLTTPSYFASTYVFVTRKSRGFDLQSFDDPALRKMKIGVQVLDDDYAPPAQSLARRGVVGNIFGFDSTGNEAGDIIRAVAHNKVDVAIVWGPLAGYYARRQRVALKITPVPPFDSPGIPFRYELSMGVRKTDKQLRDQLTNFLSSHKAAVDRILRSYGVPLLPPTEATAALSGGR
jgi:mxaJ protein